MIQAINPWTPAFSRAIGMGQIVPSILPAAAPSVATSSGGAGQTAAAVGASILTLGILGLSVAFTYGVAKESKSGLVKTTGYIMAGAGALISLLEAGAVGYAIMKA